MKFLASVVGLALGITACTLTPAQQQSAALYQQAVASGVRPTIVVGVVKTYDTGTGIVQLYDGTTYLVPASTGGHQMPTDVVGPLFTGDRIRLSYIPVGGQLVVINLEKERAEGAVP
jgi:hypothetical protein